jgi:hypothetical protein
MERMSTMVMKLEHQERRDFLPLLGALNVEVVLRYFHRHCYKSSLLWFLVSRGLRSLEF